MIESLLSVDGCLLTFVNMLCQMAPYLLLGFLMANHVVYCIEGMSCNHCKASVEKAIRGLENVENVEINLGKKEAVVTGKPSDDAVKKAVEDLGFVFKGKK